MSFRSRRRGIYCGLAASLNKTKIPLRFVRSDTRFCAGWRVSRSRRRGIFCETCGSVARPEDPSSLRSFGMTYLGSVVTLAVSLTQKLGIAADPAVPSFPLHFHP